MTALWQDVRLAFRSLRRRPAFAATAILTLALGIGANTAIFSVVHGLMYRQLPVPEAGSLVSIVERGSELAFYRQVSFPDYQDYKDLPGIFEDLATFTSPPAHITADDRSDRVITTLASGNYFDTLRLRPSQGRLFTAQEGDIGGESVLVISHAYWQSRFHGDPGVVGKSVGINGFPATIIGVTPRNFPGTVGFVEPQVYAPFSLWDRFNPHFRRELEERAGWNWRVFGRLRPDVSMEAAAAAALSVSQRLSEEYPETNASTRAYVMPEPLTRLEPAAADYMPILSAVFMGIVSLVLVIAVANVANLLLVSASGRSREVAVRSALGSGRFRILSQLVVESALLSLIAGALGLGLAHWATNKLSSLPVASDFPLFLDFSIDLKVFAFAILLALAVGVVCGLAPGLKSFKTNLVDALKEGGRSGAGAARQPLRSLLVVGQIAVSLVLMVCTALFLQSMLNVGRIDPGFETENRFMMATDVEFRNFDRARGRAFYRELLENVRSMTGVISAATGASVPMGFNNFGSRVFIEGAGEVQGEAAESRIVFYNIVSEDYFSTMGIDLESGRVLDRQDTQQSRLSAVVNRKMADFFWPGEDPLGKRFSIDSQDGPFMEIVGVVQNGFYGIPGEPLQPHFYRPLTQEYRSHQVLFVHSRHDPESLIPVVRQKVQALDPEVPIFETRTLKAHVEDGKAAILFRLPATLVGAFALIGITLAVTGLYGVISFTIVQRTREIGIRMALGATKGNITRMVSGKGLVLAGTGVVIGIGIAILATKTFANLLIGVSATDPATYGMASLGVLALALAASCLPARLRAARVEPVEALRAE